MSGLFGVFAFDRDRRLDARDLFRAARSVPHRDQAVHEEAGLAWGAQSGNEPACLAEDSERRVKAVVLGRFDERRRLADELARLGFEVEAREADLAVAAYRAWGSRFLEHITGRFALAVCDAVDRVLVLARDALGFWPLFYRVGAEDIAFSTRVQTLLDAQLAPRILDPEGAASYFRLGYIPSPRTGVRDVRSLPPGTTAIIKDARVSLGRHRSFDFGVQDDAVSLDEQLRRAEAQIEVLLKGLDEMPQVWLAPDLASVLLAAILGRAHGRTVETLSPRDLENRAERIAHLLGTRHHGLSVSPDLDDLVRLVGVLGQPFGDPHWLAWDALGRHEGRPVITSWGAQAVFAANPRYPDALTADAVRRALPGWLEGFGPDYAASVEAVIRAPRWPERVRGLNPDFTRVVESLRGPPLDPRIDPLAALQEADLRYAMADGGLVAHAAWADWFGVPVSTPYLDESLIDITSRLPSRGRIDGRDVGAGLLRIAKRMLPGRLSREPLRPNPLPVGEWMRDALREPAEMAFFGAPGGLSGLLDPVALRRTWYAHQLGWADHGPWLYALLTFELWVQSTLTDQANPTVAAN